MLICTRCALRPFPCHKSYLTSIFLTLPWLCLQWLTDNEKRQGSYCWLTVNSWHLKANTQGNIRKQNSLFLSEDFWAFLATSRSLFSTDIQPISAKFGQPLADTLNRINVLQNFFILSGFGVIIKLKKSSHKLKGATSTIRKRYNGALKKKYETRFGHSTCGESYAKQIKRV